LPKVYMQLLLPLQAVVSALLLVEVMGWCFLQSTVRPLVWLSGHMSQMNVFFSDLNYIQNSACITKFTFIFLFNIWGKKRQMLFWH
jgi:hypothetical protein